MLLVLESPNKQLQRTVTRRCGRAASASLHFAHAARFMQQRAAAQLRRYAKQRAGEVHRIGRFCRPVSMRHVVRLDRSIRGLWTVACVVFLAIAGCTDSPQQRLSGAVLRGDINTVASLLDDPHVDINWRHPAAGSVLGTAAAHDQMPIVQLLLQRGADPNIASDENMTPLHSAAYHGYAGIVQLLIDAGADVNATETRYGFTPLGYAARHGHIDAIKLLLDAGARQAPVKDGRTPIRVAEQYGQLDAANLLRVYGRSTDAAR
jgi:hypothetical protein